MSDRLITLALAGVLIHFAVSVHAQTSTPCDVSDLPANLQDGLLFYAPFCGGGDDVGPESYPAIVNGATLITDRFGAGSSAYGFNGSDTYIDYGQAAGLLGLDTLTICFWIHHEAHPAYEYDVVLGNVGVAAAGGGGYQCSIKNSTAEMRFEYRFSQVFPFAHYGIWNTDVTDSMWTFYAVTFHVVGGQGNIYKYRNGVFDGYDSFAGTIIYNDPGTFRIGTNVDTTFQRFFNGAIDDVMVYGRKLTADEIMQIQNGFAGPAGVSETPAPSISVRPNPATDHLVIDATSNGRAVPVILKDATGRPVIDVRPTAWPYVMDLVKLAPGMYVLTFEGTGMATRIVKR